MSSLFAQNHTILQLATFIGYFIILLIVALLSIQKQKNDSDFIIGGRSLNFWLTALSAHASDMSSWLFLGYPALIYTTGVFGAWAGIGLTAFMFLNWQFIAPKIRVITEQLGSLTLSSYFEARFGDTSGGIRIISGIMSILFFTFYISSGLVALGLLVETLFHLHYVVGISIGLLIVMLYVFLGGYRTVAWIDLFQGFFLLGVILFIPITLLTRLGGWSPLEKAMQMQNLSTSLFPDLLPKTFLQLAFNAAGWGLGYFGQPHIITKFMGIRRVTDMHKAKYVGISWQILALTGATLLGLIGIYLFPSHLGIDPEHVILRVVEATMSPFFAGLVLCAILAATTNVMAAQILVVASNLSEDFYKRLFRRQASAKEMLFISRLSVVLISLVGFLIAYFKISTIYQLVLYSWSGLGAAFGPLILLSLYSKKINRYGAFAGILVGGVGAAIWPYFEKTTNAALGLSIPSLLVGFVCSLIAIQGVSFLARRSLSLPIEP